MVIKKAKTAQLLADALYLGQGSSVMGTIIACWSHHRLWRLDSLVTARRWRRQIGGQSSGLCRIAESCGSGSHFLDVGVMQAPVSPLVLSMASISLNRARASQECALLSLLNYVEGC